MNQQQLELITTCGKRTEFFASNWAESDSGSTMTSAADWPPRRRAAASRGLSHLPLWHRRLSNRPELRVPAPEHFIQFVVENLRPRLQQQMRSFQRPAHLLLLDEPAAHHLVDRRFYERRADRFPLPVSLPVVGY